MPSLWLNMVWYIVKSSQHHIVSEVWLTVDTSRKFYIILLSSRASILFINKFLGLWTPRTNQGEMFSSIWIQSHVGLTLGRSKFECEQDLPSLHCRVPDNSVYWPDPMVQYVDLTRLTYDRGQFSWHSPVRGLTITTPIARSVPGLILDLFNRPYWLSPPWSIIKQSLKLRCCLFKCLYLKHRHNKSKREKTKKIKLKMKGGKIR